MIIVFPIGMSYFRNNNQHMLNFGINDFKYPVHTFAPHFYTRIGD